MRLHGPAEAETPAETPDGRRNSRWRSTKIFTRKSWSPTTGRQRNRPQRQVSHRNVREAMNLEADTLTAQFAPEGWITKLVAIRRRARFPQRSAAEEDEVSADSGYARPVAACQPAERTELVRQRRAQDRVKKPAMRACCKPRVSHGVQRWQRARIQQAASSAETLAAGTMEWTDAAIARAARCVPARTQLQADKLVMDFAEHGKARQLQATGNVQTERRVAGHPVQTATASSGIALNGRDGRLVADGFAGRREAERR